MCVIAQQYSSATFVSLHVHSHKKKFDARFKIFFSLFFFWVWNCVTSSCVRRGVCTCFCFWFEAKQGYWHKYHSMVSNHSKLPNKWIRSSHWVITDGRSLVRRDPDPDPEESRDDICNGIRLRYRFLLLLRHVQQLAATVGGGNAALTLRFSSIIGPEHQCKVSRNKHCRWRNRSFVCLHIAVAPFYCLCQCFPNVFAPRHHFCFEK